MSLPQLFPRVKGYIGTINSPVHGKDLLLAQGDNGFIIIDADSERLAGSFVTVTNEFLAHLGEELKVSKMLTPSDRNLLQRAKAWSPSLAKLSDGSLEQVVYSGLLVLSRQRKVLLQSKDHKVTFRRLNQAASVEVNGVANVFDRGGLTIARLTVSNFDKLVSAALVKGYVSSDLVREILPVESRNRKEFAFSMARWLQVYLDLEIRG
jgi:hypothetical protein